MTRFFLYTRGRTGSTPIIDELDSHPQLECHQELFLPDPLQFKSIREAYEEHGERYPEVLVGRGAYHGLRVLPFELSPRCGTA